MTQPRNPLRPFVGANIPHELRKLNRWAPWRAQWNEKRQKWDKIPCQANGYGLSTAKPERWLSYDAALAALRARPDQFAGIGYCMTGPHGLVGIDMDGCLNADGSVQPWAREIVDQLASYTEVSPSGRGLRIFIAGDVLEDWTNHDQGLEVYGGHEARFLTVTGEVISTAHATVMAAPPEVLAELSQRYARVKTSATVISLNLPDLVDELALPDLADLDLPWQARAFLTEGKHRGDRSRELFSTAVALYAAGLRDDEVLSVLAASSHAFEVALDHRRQDSDRALMYLWVEHAQKAKGRATRQVATADDFEDVSAAVGSPPAKKPRRFVIQHCSEFAAGKPVRWAIKRLIPLADLGAVIGESGTGKSFFVLDLVFSIATGRPWRGKKVNAGPVLYICAEGAGGFRARLKAYAAYHGVELTDCPVHVLGDTPNMMEKQDLKDLLEAISDLPPVSVVVLDTLAQVTPGANENSGEDMGRALGHCKVLNRKTGAMVLLVAHTGKDSAKGLRGWSGIKGALDVEITVEESGKYRAATVTKMKDGEGEGDEHAFELESVVVDHDSDGEPVSSCAIREVAAVPKAQRKAEPKGAIQQLVLRLAEGMADLPGAFTTGQLVDAAVNELPKPEGKRDQRRGHVMQAVESLVGSNRLSVAGGVVEVLL